MKVLESVLKMFHHHRLRRRRGRSVHCNFKMQRLLLMMAVLAALSVASLLLGFFYLRQRQMIRIRPEVRAEKVKKGFFHGRI